MAKMDAEREGLLVRMGMECLLRRHHLVPIGRQVLPGSVVASLGECGYMAGEPREALRTGLREIDAAARV